MHFSSSVPAPPRPIRGFLNAAEIAAAVPRVSGGGAYLLAGALSTFGVEEQDCQVEDAVWFKELRTENYYNGELLL